MLSETISVSTVVPNFPLPKNVASGNELQIDLRFPNGSEMIEIVVSEELYSHLYSSISLGPCRSICGHPYEFLQKMATPTASHWLIIKFPNKDCKTLGYPGILGGIVIKLY
jgi:hypothetical protein